MSREARIANYVADQADWVARRLSEGGWTIDVLREIKNRLDRLMHQAESKFGPINTLNDVDPVTMTIEATAQAIGENTYAQATNEARLGDFNGYTAGVARSSASATTEGGGDFSLVDCYSDFSGADLVVSHTIYVVGTNYVAQETKYFVLDLEWWSGDEPIVYETEETIYRDDTIDIPDANVADFGLDVAVFGDNPFVDTYGDATTVDNALSDATAASTLTVTTTPRGEVIDLRNNDGNTMVSIADPRNAPALLVEFDGIEFHITRRTDLEAFARQLKRDGDIDTAAYWDRDGDALFVFEREDDGTITESILIDGLFAGLRDLPRDLKAAFEPQVAAVEDFPFA